MVSKQQKALYKYKRQYAKNIQNRKLYTRKKRSSKSHRTLSSSRAKFYQSSRVISRWAVGLKA